MDSVVFTSPDIYEISLIPQNPNDPGSPQETIQVGFYVKDYVGHTYTVTELVSTSPTRVKVQDTLGVGVGPQEDRYGFVYRSAGDGYAPYLAPIDTRRLDDSALDYSRKVEMDVAWKHRGVNLTGYGDFDEDNITKLTLSKYFSLTNPLGGWAGGKSYDVDLLMGVGTGARCTPEWTNNGNGSITLEDCTFNFYDNEDGMGLPFPMLVSGATVSFTDQVYNYVVASYNGGSPVLSVTTDVSIINETTVLPVLSVLRRGTLLCTTFWDALGSAKLDKLHQSIVKTQRYRRESGLNISVEPTRRIKITNGIVWIGAVKVSLNEVFQGDIATTTRFIYKTGGVWTESFTSQFDSTLYQGTTDLQTLTNNMYCVVFVYRGVETQNHIYYVYGTGDYNLSQAQGASVPNSIPAIITSHCVLVGRIIIQKGSDTITEISSAFDVTFSIQPGVSNHNDLPNLNVLLGGHTANVINTDTTNFNGILSSADDTVQKALDTIDNYTSSSTRAGLLVFTYTV